MEFSVPLARRRQTVSESILVAWWTGFSAYASIADIAGFILRFALIHSIDPVWIQIELAPIGKSRKATG